MQEKVTFKNSLGYTLSGVLHTPDQSVEHPAGVVVCHGMGGVSDKSFIEFLAQNFERSNFVVLQPELTGRGESGGEFTEGTYSQWTDDIKRAIDFLNSRGVRRIGLVGYSQSGASVILTAAQDRRVNAIVPISPVGYPARLKGNKFDAKEIRAAYEKNLPVVYNVGNDEFKLYKNFFKDLDEQNVIKESREVHQPTLIIHGSADRTIIPQESLDIYNNLGSDNKLKKRVIIEEADHTFNKRNRKYLNKISKLAINWFTKYLPYESQAVRAWIRHNGRLLIVKRSDRMESYPGKWSSIGGFLDKGNSIKQQALIEIEEETGITQDQLSFIKQDNKPIELYDKNSDKLWIIHQMLFESTTDKVILDWEATEHKWIKPEEIKNYDTIPGVVEFFEKFYE